MAKSSKNPTCVRGIIDRRMVWTSDRLTYGQAVNPQHLATSTHNHPLWLTLSQCHCYILEQYLTLELHAERYKIKAQVFLTDYNADEIVAISR